MNFTEIKPRKYDHKYLLVLIDTFPGIKAFLTKQEMASVVIKKILEEIFPLSRVPKVIWSDNSPTFVAKVSQGVAKYLEVD